MKMVTIIHNAFSRYMVCTGMLLTAIALEADNLEALPEFQRAWYEQDAATKKFKLNPAKVEVEDVTGLKATVTATREEARRAKAAADARVAEALKPFEGIDPAKARAIMAQFEDADEAALLAQGKEGLEKILTKRNAKRDAEVTRQLQEAQSHADGAMEVASTFMERVLDNHVRAAAAAAGLHPSAIEDALLRARAIFSLDDEGNAVQFTSEDDETPVLGKDGKTPFSPAEWLEGMRTSAPHWFPAGASGGGAGGSRQKGGAPDFSGMSPTARLTAARTAQGK